MFFRHGSLESNIDAAAALYVVAAASSADFSDGGSLNGRSIDNEDLYVYLSDNTGTYPNQPEFVAGVDFFYGNGTPPSAVDVEGYTSAHPSWVRRDNFAGSSQGYDFQGSVDGLPTPWTPPSSPGGSGDGTAGDKWIAVKVDSTITGSPTVEVAIATFTLTGVNVGTPVGSGGGSGHGPTPPLGRPGDVIGAYNGNNPAYLPNAEAQLGGVAITYVHQMAAPSDKDFNSVRAAINGYRAWDVGSENGGYIPLITMHGYDDSPHPTYGSPDTSPAAQAAAFNSMINGDNDAILTTICGYFDEILSIHPRLHIQLNHESSGNWQGHRIYAGQEGLWADLWRYVHDFVCTTTEGLTAGNATRIIWDWNHPKRASSGGDPVLAYPTGVSPVTGRDYVDTHSTNIYFDSGSAATAANHLYPEGPFGPINPANKWKDNTTSDLVFGQVCTSSSSNGSPRWNIIDQVNFAGTQGKPWGITEVAPGTGDTGESDAAKAKWCHDDPRTVTKILEFCDLVSSGSPIEINGQAVTDYPSGLWGFCYFDSSTGGTGTRWRELPNAWNQLKVELLARRA